MGLAGLTPALGHIQPSCGHFKQLFYLSAQLGYGFVDVTNERWLRWAIGRHFRTRGFQVNMNGVRAGNAVLDGEVKGKSWKMALEVKSSSDDPIRGIGQLAEALCHGYQTAALVTSLRHAKRLDKAVFKDGLVLLGIDSKTRVRQVYP